MQNERRFSPFTNFLLQAWLPVLLVVFWAVASVGSKSLFWPPLSKIVDAFWKSLTKGTLLTDVVYSFTNYFIAIAIALIVGLGIGTLIGLRPKLSKVLMPFLDFLRSTPPVVFVPIIILTLGIGPLPKILLIAFACTWPVLLNTVEGVRGIAPSVLESSRAYRIPVHLQVGKVILPGALPQIAVGVRVAITVGIVMVVVSEMYGSTQGVGYFILLSGQNFAVANTWAGTIFIGVLGYLITAIYGLVEHRMLRWYRQEAPKAKRAKPIEQQAPLAPAAAQ